MKSGGKHSIHGGLKNKAPAAQDRSHGIPKKTTVNKDTRPATGMMEAPPGPRVA